jgi:putative membrane protein
VRLIVFRRRVEDEGPRKSRLLALVVRLAINAAALWVAALVISGIEISGPGSLVGTALIFGPVNALIKPVAHVLGCPLTCLTLGLFALVINAAMLALTAWIADGVGLDVSIDGFLAAILGALLISVVSWALNLFVGRPIRGVLRG